MATKFGMAEGAEKRAAIETARWQQAATALYTAMTDLKSLAMVQGTYQQRRHLG